MLIETYVLGVGLATIFLLVLHKVWEMKQGYTFLPRKILNKSDEVIQNRIDYHKEVVIPSSKRNARVLFFVVNQSVRHVVLVVMHAVHRWVTRVIIKLRGANIRRTKGSVSFFLKHVSEYKNSLHNEVIKKAE
jgi:DNA-binding protein